MADKVVSAIIRALRPQFQELVMGVKAMMLDWMPPGTQVPRQWTQRRMRSEYEFRSEIKGLTTRWMHSKTNLYDIARVEQKVDFAKQFEVLKVKVAE